jgi:hypothetical protein
MDVVAHSLENGFIIDEIFMGKVYDTISGENNILTMSVRERELLTLMKFHPDPVWKQVSEATATALDTQRTRDKIRKKAYRKLRGTMQQMYDELGGM